MLKCFNCFKKDAYLNKPLFKNYYYCIYCNKGFTNNKSLKKHNCNFKSKK